jgi:hypothetical protein
MFFSLLFFSCTNSTTDIVVSPSTTVEEFDPVLLFIHELWLHPGDPDRLMNPQENWNVSLRLYGPHHARTQSEEDVCAWYGNLKGSEIVHSTFPYEVQSRLELVQSDCPDELTSNLNGAHIALMIEQLFNAQQNNIERLYRQQEQDPTDILPYTLGARSGIGIREQQALQEHGWALNYQMEDGQLAQNENGLILQEPSSLEPNRALRIMGLAPSSFEWFWDD